MHPGCGAPRQHPGPGRSETPGTLPAISPGLEVVFADGGYAGALATWIKDLPRPTPLRLEIIKRPREATGFHLLPKRWVVERTFAWLANFRRFSIDYEVKTAHSEAMIYLANASLMARKLAKN